MEFQVAGAEGAFMTAKWNNRTASLPHSLYAVHVSILQSDIFSRTLQFHSNVQLLS